MTGVGAAIALRHEHFNRLIQQLGPRITEELLGQSVNESDPALLINRQHCARRSVKARGSLGNLPLQLALRVAHLDNHRVERTGKPRQFIVSANVDRVGIISAADRRRRLRQRM